jgi:hypothetical protein
MATLSEDTSPQAERVLVQLARKMSPGQKLEIAGAMSRTLWKLAEAGVRSSHPGAGEDEIRKRLSRRLLPRQLVTAAYGRDPEKEEYRLEVDYLARWAKDLGLEGLLDRALREATADFP